MHEIVETGDKPRFKNGEDKRSSLIINAQLPTIRWELNKS